MNIRQGEIKMFKKIMPYFNIGLASVMLFIAMPNLNFSGSTAGELFWVLWTVICLVIMAANGNMILMSKEKKERLQQIKRMRKIKQEQTVINLLNRKQMKARAKERAKQTG